MTENVLTKRWSKLHDLQSSTVCGHRPPVGHNPRWIQIMGMIRLAPKIQQHIMPISETNLRPEVTEHALRPLGRIDNSSFQLREFQRILGLPPN